MKIIEKEIGELTAYENNSRTHSDDQIKQIVASINEFGFTNPILINPENGVIVGHGRLTAAIELGMDKVPCIVLDGLTEAQERAYVIADNQLALNAGWNMDILALELADLKDMAFDIDLIGFDGDFLDGLMMPEPSEGLTDDDAVPEAPDDPITKEGDVWVLGNHRLMCGDSTSIDAVEKLMDGLKPNAIFTDPPYGIGLDKEGQKIGKSQAYGAVMNDHSSDVAKDAFRLAQAMAVPELYFWGANHYSSVLPDSSCWIVWDKQGGKSVTYADCELCYTNIDKPVRMFTHIWDGFRRDSEKGKTRVHPTQKPVKLFVDIWEKFNTGQVVMDLFLGSGSTLIACESSDRVCYGMELDPKYVDVIITRWQDYTGNDAVLESSGETYSSYVSRETI
tara:strand:+ start:1477 stop:2655 length:1179 start_codon:yes stop_codon:yes gene_type:complete